MNSEWFILKKNEHLGPFSKKQILEMVYANEVEESVQIWREGWTHARSLDDAFLDEPNYADSDVPPPLPPLFPAPKLKESVVALKDGPTTSASKPVKTIKTKNHHKQNKMAARSRRIRVGIALGVLATFLVLVFVLLPELSSPKIFSRPALMDISAHNRLTEIAKAKGVLKASASLSNDKKILWIALNSPLNGKVFISMKSLADQTLEGYSQLEATGFLTDRLIELSQFQFISGTRLVEGNYQVEIKSLDEMELPFWSRFSAPQTVTLDYSDQLLISSQSQKNFEKQLAKILQRKRSNSQKFWEELIQKYQTVMMISDQIKDGFLKVFDSPITDWSENTKKFESEYAAKYGVFFTEFVKANEASYQKIYSKKFENVNEVLANYNHLSKLATEIGEHSMFILENLQNFKGDEEAGKELAKTSLEKLESIITRCRNKLQLLTESL